MSPAALELRLLALYPEQMNIYADRGNILFLQRRCEWRGIGFALRGGRPRRGLRPGRARPDLHRRRPGPRPAAGRRGHAARPSATRSPSAVDDGAALLAVCGGYQLLGHSYQLGDQSVAGLGVADLETVREPGPRLIGNVEIEVDLGSGPEGAGGLREPRRAHLPRAGPPSRSAASCTGYGNNGRTATRASCGRT